MRSKKHREPPEFETIQAAIEGDAEAIKCFPIFSHLSTVSVRENTRMNLGEFIMWLMNI